MQEIQAPAVKLNIATMNFFWDLDIIVYDCWFWKNIQMLRSAKL
jgi:hypothetical protein